MSTFPWNCPTRLLCVSCLAEQEIPVGPWQLPKGWRHRLSDNMQHMVFACSKLCQELIDKMPHEELHRKLNEHYPLPEVKR